MSIAVICLKLDDELSVPVAVGNVTSVSARGEVSVRYKTGARKGSGCLATRVLKFNVGGSLSYRSAETAFCWYNDSPYLHDVAHQLGKTSRANARLDNEWFSVVKFDTLEEYNKFANERGIKPIPAMQVPAGVKPPLTINVEGKTLAELQSELTHLLAWNVDRKDEKVFVNTISQTALTISDEQIDHIQKDILKSVKDQRIARTVDQAQKTLVRKLQEIRDREGDTKTEDLITITHTTTTKKSAK